MKAAPIDVSSLPAHTLDHRSPIWWGNLLLLVIETVMFAILIASYFYLYRNFPVWPPVRSSGPHVEYSSQPELVWATANLVVMLVGVLPMVVADRSALHRNRPWVDIGIVVAVLFGLVEIWLRWKEFGVLRFQWDDNAYASVIWMILGVHFIHLIVGTAEAGIMTAWLLLNGMDDQHARDVRLTAIYWYWITGIWVPLYLLVYFAPRWL